MRRGKRCELLVRLQKATRTLDFVERAPPGDQRIKKNSRRVDVGARVDLLPLACSGEM